MFLIVNHCNQVFSRITTHSLLGSEIWAAKIDLDHMIPIQVTIFPDESTANTTINNILAFRQHNNLFPKGSLRVILFTEYFKG